jgi:hypothetical protein
MPVTKGPCGFRVKKFSPQKNRVRSHVYQKLFGPRPQRLCGAISDPWFTRKPELLKTKGPAPSGRAFVSS